MINTLLRKTALMLVVSFGIVGNAGAGAVWVDYQMKVDPAKAGQVVKAMQAYMDTDTGKDFDGVMLLNAQVANGTNPATHNWAIVHKDMKAWEARQASIAGSSETAKLLRKVNMAGEMISETVYEHVTGFGAPTEEALMWVAYAMQVSDAAKYVSTMTRFMEAPGSIAEIASADLWAVRAGGTPGVTHIAVVGVKSRAGYLQDPRTSKFLADFGKAVGESRRLLGVSFANRLLIGGPLTSSEWR